jgi:glyoxylase-like metal-dependent hydrolase (beta-lactamase superfamily II)
MALPHDLRRGEKPMSTFHPLGRLSVALSAVALAACASLQPVSLDTAAAALKADDVHAIEVSGTGNWYQFGQAPAPGLPWPAFAVSRYSASIDYDHAAARVQITRRQIVEPGRERPAPVDQVVDQYVAATQAWNRGTAANGPVTPQPAAVAERAAEIWSTPQGFLKAAQAHHAETRRSFAGTEVSFNVDAKTRYVGLLNGRGEVERVQTWIDTPVLGDTLVETRFSNYRVFDGIPFPAHIERSQGGHPVLDLTVSAVKAKAAPLAAAPALTATPPVAVGVNQLATGVYYLTGGTHHSVAIEQRDNWVLVEAPLNEERSLALIAQLKKLAPNKPIRTVVNTHVHFDHSGGLRTLVAEGATVVTAQANQPYYEQAWAAPRTLNPDRLSVSGRSAQFETFSGRKVLSDGQRQIEVIEIAGNGHNDAFALIWLPAEKVLIEADAYTPGPANAPVATPANPYTVNLYQNIQRLGLDVQQIAALHGPRVTTLADLRAAVGQAPTAQR